MPDLTYYNICLNIFTNAGINCSTMHNTEGIISVTHGSVYFTRFNSQWVPDYLRYSELSSYRLKIFNFRKNGYTVESVRKFAHGVVDKIRKECKYREMRKHQIAIKNTESKFHSMPLHSLIEDLFPGNKAAKHFQSGVVVFDENYSGITITPLHGDKPYRIDLHHVMLSTEHLEKFLQLMKEANVISG